MTSQTPDTQRLDLGTCQLDLGSGLVLKAGAAVPIRARSLAVLRLLASRAGEVVSKAELIETVWADVAVTDDSLTQAIRDIRVQIGDDAGTVLRTAARRGYMLVPGPPPAPAPTQAGDPRPRIGILPFTDQTGTGTGTGDTASLIALLNEETAAGLSRFRSFIVLSPRSVSAAASAEPDPLRLAERLKASYLVYGTARPAAGSGFRLSLELIDAQGALLWTEVFDCSGTALLEQPDAIPRRILGQLSASLEDGELARLRYHPTSSLTALAHFAQGNAIFDRADPGQYALAKAELDAACAADPAFGLAQSMAALADIAAAGFGLAPPEVLQRAVAAARRGVELAPTEARCLSTLGYMQLYLSEFASAERNITAAHRLNPYSVDIMMHAADMELSRGRPGLALAWLDRMIEVSPVPGAFEDMFRFEALFLLERFDEAAAAIGRLPHPDLKQRIWTAAIAARRGDRATVVREMDAVAEREPGWDHRAIMRAAYNYEHEADTRRMLDAVDLALQMWRRTA